jgi:hypothetical protein
VSVATTLPVASTIATLTGVEAHRGAAACGRGEQQVAQVGREDADRALLGHRAQPHPDVDRQVQQDPGAPRPADGVGQPLVGRAALVPDPERGGDRALVVGDDARFARLGLRFEGDVEHLLLLPAEGREDPVGRQFRERLGEVEVVGEFRRSHIVGGRLALPDRGDQPPPRPHPLTQPADEVGVLGEALDEDGAGALQRGGDVGDLLAEVALRERVRVLRRVGEQRVGERFEAVLPRDHRLGAALRLVREVDVLEPGLRLRGHDPGFEGLVELALLADLVEDDRAPLLQLTQVPQALLQGAQLRVVERPGGLLAVPGDERHGGAAVQQVDRGRHLVRAHAELVGDAVRDRLGSGRPGRGLLRGRERRAGHPHIVPVAPQPVDEGSRRAVSPSGRSSRA